MTEETLTPGEEAKATSKLALIDVGKRMKPKDYFGNKPYAFSTEYTNGAYYVVVSELNVPGNRMVLFSNELQVAGTGFKTENEAENVVIHLNSDLGLSDKQVQVIILSSMFVNANPHTLVGSLKDAYFGLLKKNDSKEKTI